VLAAIVMGVTSPQAALWGVRSPQTRLWRRRRHKRYGYSGRHKRALWATSPPQAVLRPARLNALSADTGIPVSELIQVGTGGATRDGRAAIRGETGVSGATLAARSQHYASDPVAVTPVPDLSPLRIAGPFFTVLPSQRRRLERECNLSVRLANRCPNLALRTQLPNSAPRVNGRLT
jgi:hypothetical protein